MLEETLLWIFRLTQDEEHLNAVSTFLHHAFEYAETKQDGEQYLSAGSFR